MKPRIQKLIMDAFNQAVKDGNLSDQALPDVEVEIPKNTDHGDFSTNIAMKMAASQKMAPRKIAEFIRAAIHEKENKIEKIEIAGPGFINFYVSIGAWHHVLQNIHEQNDLYGGSDIGSRKRSKEHTRQR